MEGPAGTSITYVQNLSSDFIAANRVHVVRVAALLPNGQHFRQVQIKNICFVHKTHQIAKLQKKCMVAVGLEPASPQLSARHSSTEPH